MGLEMSNLFYNIGRGGSYRKYNVSGGPGSRCETHGGHWVLEVHNNELSGLWYVSSEHLGRDSPIRVVGGEHWTTDLNWMPTPKQIGGIIGRLDPAQKAHEEEIKFSAVSWSAVDFVCCYLITVIASIKHCTGEALDNALRQSIVHVEKSCPNLLPLLLSQYQWRYPQYYKENRSILLIEAFSRSKEA